MQSNASTGSSRPLRSWRSCWQGYAAIRTVKDVCREHKIAETLYYAWRDKIPSDNVGGVQARGSQRKAGSSLAGQADPGFTLSTYIH